MAATIDLIARAICGPGYYSRNGRCYPKSSWYYWGRWVVAAVVIFVSVSLVFIFCCVRSRRQRRHGLRPMYGTGWMAPPGKFGNQQPPPHQQWAGGSQPAPPPYGQPPNQYQYGPPPPGVYNSNVAAGSPYGPPQTGGDYYGQTAGVQQPPNTYQSVYSPPAGPPPGK